MSKANKMAADQKNKKKSSHYRQLKCKLLFNILLLLILTAVTMQVLYRFVFYGNIANWVVGFLEYTVYLGRRDAYEMALETYQQVVRNHLGWYYIGINLFCFMIFWGIYLNVFVRYFNEINRGIDALVREDAADIKLSRELSDIEDRINSIKHTLQKRKDDAQLAEQRKNDLIVYLAHDLKTPLTSVIGYLTLLSEKPDLPWEERCHYTDIALDKAERLEELINEFFDITRLNLTALTLEEEKIHLSRMLEQITAEFHPILEERQLYWRTQIAPGIEITGDVNKLERVFDNLIRNAVNYSYAGTELFCSADQVDGKARICIKNHGETIPADRLESIFEQFYRIDTSRTTSTGGAGLGLAIAREIVELHAGTITASCEQESICFVVELPTG